MNMIINRLLMVLFIALMLACENAPSSEITSPDSDSPSRLVVASNFPLYYFAREIAGDTIIVEFPSIEGDPAYWKPKSESIQTLQSADLVILNGAGYESWLNWISLPERVLLDTTVTLGEHLLPLDEATVHQHGPEGEHSHMGYAFTTWLDPMLAIEQARVIASALSKLSPQNPDDHTSRLAQLESRLLQLDSDLEAAFAPYRDQPVVFSHPVYQYLADRYGLDGASVHWEPGEAPGTRAWIEFQELQRTHAASWMIWEGEPDPATRQRLEQMQIRVVVFDTASNPPVGSDYFQIMQQNVSSLNTP
jgi:zinc transport system substrate-binding protein